MYLILYSRFLDPNLGASYSMWTTWKPFITQHLILHKTHLHQQNSRYGLGQVQIKRSAGTRCAWKGPKLHNLTPARLCAILHASLASAAGRYARISDGHRHDFSSSLFCAENSTKKLVCMPRIGAMAGEDQRGQSLAGFTTFGISSPLPWLHPHCVSQAATLVPLHVASTYLGSTNGSVSICVE